ncbi:TlpA disulfide reductase family protein [Deferrisoma sp.]
MLKRIVSVACCAVLLLGVAVGGAGAEEKKAEKPTVSLKVGDPVVDVMVDGKSLAKEVGQKGVVIWAQSACSACRHELSNLGNLKEKFKDTKFVVIMVDVGGKEMASRVVDKYGVDKVATVLYDPEFQSGEKYGVYSTPYAVVVKGGKVVERLGNLNPRENQLAAALGKL